MVTGLDNIKVKKKPARYCSIIKQVKRYFCRNLKMPKRNYYIALSRRSSYKQNFPGDNDILHSG